LTSFCSAADDVKFLTFLTFLEWWIGLLLLSPPTVALGELAQLAQFPLVIRQSNVFLWQHATATASKIGRWFVATSMPTLRPNFSKLRTICKAYL
jgi:hypothetical protein